MSFKNDVKVNEHVRDEYFMNLTEIESEVLSIECLVSMLKIIIYSLA